MAEGDLEIEHSLASFNFLGLRQAVAILAKKIPSGDGMVVVRWLALCRQPQS